MSDQSKTGERLCGKYHYAKLGDAARWNIHRSDDHQIVEFNVDAGTELAAKRVIQRWDEAVERGRASKSHEISASSRFAIETLNAVVEDRDIERRHSHIWLDAGRAVARLRAKLPKVAREIDAEENGLGSGSGPFTNEQMGSLQEHVTECHDLNLGGEHRAGFCKACADTYLYGQYALSRFSK